MAPFVVVALVAAGLFGTGTVVREQQPVVGTVLQGAAVGTLVGGGIGAAVGVPSALATGFGATTTAGLVTGTAAVGAGVGAAGGYVLQTRAPTVIAPFENTLQNDVTVLKKDVASLKAKRHKKKVVASK
jgi:uncharacterized protein YcfJ